MGSTKRATRSLWPPSGALEPDVAGNLRTQSQTHSRTFFRETRTTLGRCSSITSEVDRSRTCAADGT